MPIEPPDDDGPSVAFPLERLPDGELTDLCRAGVETAFAALYDRHRRFVHSYALRLLGSPAAAADVHRRAFEAYFDELSGGGSPPEPAIGLYRRVRALALESIRNARRARGLPPDETEVRIPDLPPGADAPRRIRILIETVPPAYREILYLRLIENRPEAETAAIAGVPETVVRARLAGGLDLLRQAVRRSPAADPPEGRKAARTP